MQNCSECKSITIDKFKNIAAWLTAVDKHSRRAHNTSVK
jgi:hypothetical protein